MTAWGVDGEVCSVDGEEESFESLITFLHMVVK